MITLNLATKDSQQERIKNYLQENVSESLADKINNGVRITKDGKPYISKKDLDGFFEYACKTAQEQSEKGKRSAMVEDAVVFGWAIHYFEEDGIEGSLYNPDGTKYEPPKPKYTPKPTTAVTPPPKKDDIQPNMFDLLNEKSDNTDDETDDDEELTEEEKREAFNELAKEDYTKVSPSYARYLEIQNRYPDCIVSYRLGDFYEVFGENAVTLANSLELTLTSRDVGLSERIPMIGFPYHAAEIYIQKIINNGFKVAIAEHPDDITVKQNDMKIDFETGEILNDTFGNLTALLKELFGNAMEIRL